MTRDGNLLLKGDLRELFRQVDLISFQDKQLVIFFLILYELNFWININTCLKKLIISLCKAELRCQTPSVMYFEPICSYVFDSSHWQEASVWQRKTDLRHWYQLLLLIITDIVKLVNIFISRCENHWSVEYFNLRLRSPPLFVITFYSNFQYF